VGSAERARARALKQQYDEHKFSSPDQAAAAASAIGALADSVDDVEVRALADWTAAMAALHLRGEANHALPLIERAAAGLLSLGHAHDAATTQLTRMHALGMLGRYAEAVAGGEWAARVFAEHGDSVAAGKVEQNLGNLSLRRDDYAAAERFYRSARDRFLPTQDPGLLARAENNLGYALLLRHEFRAAGEALARAWASAELAGSSITQAEIEDNLGCLGLVQGRFDEALDYLERARARLVALNMPHDAAIAERELADAYLELNLIPEAAEIYERVVPAFARLGMRAEHAWALVHQARALQALGRLDQTATCLVEADALYAAEGNPVGRAMVSLAEAELRYSQRDFERSVQSALQAEGPFASAGAWSRLLQSRWLRADALRALGDDSAEAVLTDVLADAKRRGLPHIELRCHTSLGLLARARSDGVAAEQAFDRALEIVEQLRAPLPGDQFRSAFLGQHMVPFTEMARLSLERGRPAEALQYVEQARSRALLDMLGTVPTPPSRQLDERERGLVDRLAQLRQELNWIYTQVDRGGSGGLGATTAHLEVQATERESTILRLSRQLQQRSGDVADRVAGLDLTALQHDLGDHSALVEYFSLDGEVLAFVVTDAGVSVARELADEAQVAVTVQQLRYQIDTLRLAQVHVRRHIDQLTTRTQHHLAALYALLLRPIEPLLGDRRLVVVPHRALHYIPFQALYDGVAYVIERHEVVYAPSAAVLDHCVRQTPDNIVRALLVGVPDARAPRMREEVLALAPLFEHADLLLDEAARLETLRERAPAADLVHLACHGQFRPDSPLFSSLQLADGRLTVRDASVLDLARCQLVVLSACETGISALAPGNELIGLTGGFLAAGTPSLIVSLWTVDDATTAELMRTFYERLRLGEGCGAALRYAQRSQLAHTRHPFFWSPFGLVGRW
jgi:CHAT domain-containing protein